MSSSIYFRPDLEEADTVAADAAIERDFARILGDKSLVFDIGANRGQFAEKVLTIKPDATVYSFEPVPDAFKDLKILSEIKTGIVPKQLAVSEITGDVTIHVMMSDVGSSLLQPLPGQSSKWLTPAHDILAQSTRLDDFINANGFSKIDLLKSDAQGADLAVLKSAGKYFNPEFIKAIFVELNMRDFYSGQSNFGDIISEVTKKGFRLAWFYPHRSHDEWLWWADALFIAS